MNKQEISLKFDKQLSKLAGNKFGRSTYCEQVKPVIDFQSDYFEFKFPNEINRIASSFIQGFFDELMKSIGLKGIKEKVLICSSIEGLKEFIVNNLGC